MGKRRQLAGAYLLTKADKLKHGARQTALLQTKQKLAKLDLPFSVQLFSALHKIGLDELAVLMGTWLRLDSIDSTNNASDAGDAQLIDGSKK